MITIENLSAELQNKRVALEVLRTTAIQHEAMLTAWRQAMDLIWLSPDPAGCVAELGKMAVTIFQVSTMTCNFLEAMAPGCTAEKLALMAQWQITSHSDGTITVAAIESSAPAMEPSSNADSDSAH